MEPEILNRISVEMNWTVIRKGRTSMTRRPRKLGADSFVTDFKVHEPTSAFERKKQRVLNQSISSTPQTPSFLHEDSIQQCQSNSHSMNRKTKSKTRLRNSKMLKPKNNTVQDLFDFSGIELLASVACSSIIHDNKNNNAAATPEINSCAVDIKDIESNGSLIQQNLQDIREEVEVKKVVISKELRLHWDLNTVMDEWENPCDDLLIVKSDVNNGSVEETHELIDTKTSDGDSCVSKSDAVDLLTHPDIPVVNQQSVCEEFVQDHVSECCGSNVTQEHMDSEEKLEVGYDSPFEDGELREKPEKETVFESDKIYKDELGIIENPLSEKVDHGQTARDQTSLLEKEAVPVPHFDESRKDCCERKLLQIDKSTSFDVCKNGEYNRQTRSVINEDFSMRIWDLKSHRSLDSNFSRNHNLKSGIYRTHDRKPSPTERNNGYGYGSYRGPPTASSHNRDRYRFQSHKYHDHKQSYLERKPRVSRNFNRHHTRSRSRSRSRSGSPIAWHFQKRKDLDTNNHTGEIETVTKSGGQSSVNSGYFRDKSQSSVMMKQRVDPNGYSESRLKSDDYFRFSQRSTSFSSGYKYYKDNQ